MEELWDGDPDNPTIQEIMDGINPGYHKLNFASGTPRTLLKHMDQNAIVFWQERFSAVFAIRNGANKLRFYAAVNLSPMGSNHLPVVSKRQVTSIISMRPDIALSFLEDANREDYHQLQAESYKNDGEYLGGVFITRSKPITRWTGYYPDTVYEFIGRKIENIITLHVYKKNGELIVKTSAWGEVGTHARKAMSNSKYSHRSSFAWAEQNLIVGTRKTKLSQQLNGVPEKEHHYLWKTTTTLTDDIHRSLIGMQTMENLLVEKMKPEEEEE